MIRKHQIEMQAGINDIKNGSPIKYILAKVTPGGGKSALPIIAGALITTGLADKLCWIVPRQSLQRQGESNFQDPFFREMFGHQLLIRSSTNERNPCRGLDGFITTYQAIGVDSSHTVLGEFQKRRYIIVLDEFHHAELGGVWHNAIDPLVKLAKYVILMTGTLERGSGTRIAFARYGEIANRYVPELKSDESMRVIEYSRADALAEEAIIPLHFFLNDGAASWKDKTGVEIKYKSISRARDKDVRSAVYTAIDTDFANQLLNSALLHWHKYRQDINPRAKFLVVTANIKHAKKAIIYLRDKFFNAQIATSHESKKAAAAIRAFRSGKIDILVTIAMAYEGLDVPLVSHIAALTHIRSVPWIEQMLARAVRVAPSISYAAQYAYIFAPDDPLLRDIVAKIKKEQLPLIRKRSAGKQAVLFEDEKSGESDPDKNPYGIIPIGSSLTEKRDVIVGSDQPWIPDTIPSDRESYLRDAIECHVRKYSFNHRYRNGQINSEIKQAFGKSRADMTIAELERCLAYIQRIYPLSTPGIMQPMPGVSGPRATRPRVPTKAVFING